MAEQKDLLINNSILYRCTQKYYDNQLAQYGIGYGQVVYLILIYEREGLTMKELAETGSFDRGTITKAISKLEKLNYVYLKDNPNDKRSKLLYTTEEAKDLITKLYMMRKEWWDHLNEQLSPEESERFSDLMQKVVDQAQSYTNVEISQIQFYGIQKLTLLDYPDKMACTLFTGGCDMKCPFCQNSDLVFLPESMIEIDQGDIFNFLMKRRGVLEGVCISGGEPLIHKGLKNVLKRIKALGYKIKLDTNGTFPDRLCELIDEDLVDYVAMDIKNCLDKYGTTCGMEGMSLSGIKESVDLLLQKKVPYEFRTTIVKEYHSKDDMRKIGEWIRGAEAYYLQKFVGSEKVIKKGLHAIDDDEMYEYREIVGQYVKRAAIRGVE